MSSEKVNENPWVRVTTRRSHSLDSLKNKIKVKFLNTRQGRNDPVIEAAEKNLTPEQCERIRNHNVVVRTRQESNSSRVDGPSKGKGPDPQNWGNIDRRELEPEIQKQLL